MTSDRADQVEQGIGAVTFSDVQVIDGLVLEQSVERAQPLRTERPALKQERCPPLVVSIQFHGKFREDHE